MVDGMRRDEEACWLIAFLFFVWVWAHVSVKFDQARGLEGKNGFLIYFL
jgi:hypothetical protein